MSFSQKVKEEISEISPKIRSCCLYSYLYGMAFSASLQEERYISKTTFAENAKLLNEKLSLLLKKQENG